MDSFEPKAPTEVRPYWFDFRPLFAAFGDTCASATVVAVDQFNVPLNVPPITITNISPNAAGLVEFWVSGGTLGDRVILRGTATGARTNPLSLIRPQYHMLPIAIT